MTDKRVIVVAGATGNQGGAVVNALVDRWHVRALTRDTSSAAARALTGIEVVAGDMAELDSLRTALKGAYGVFGVQNSRTAA
ncbi:NmrA family NAD(P)-binding protein [Kibdelosporangium philippinense]|uniref:NmrA family NAD(P)-binding protein n=1 Tax=Kibdelosporangium philippinense TaxID=211113 RepID=UPI0024C25A13|nr:NmrA family NAD(P)-binding protein [Kibdelosporangium philippinense]